MATPFLPPGRFHGRILGSRGASGVCMTEARIEPRLGLPTHSHELAFFCLLVDGSYREDSGSRTRSYGPFTVAFHPPGEPHRSDIGVRGARVFNVEIPGSWLDGSVGEVAQPVADRGGGELTWLAARLFREYRDDLAGPPIALEALVCEMLALARGSARLRERQRPAWLSRAIDLLQSEFRQSLRISQVAAEVGTHPTHLSRVFRDRMGLPIGDYVHRLRVRHAGEELCRPGARLADVAVSAGFADQSHLTRVFKRVTGVTPAAFRGQVSTCHIRSQPTDFSGDRGHSKSQGGPRFR
jgi:AraC family transcriptional regulator